MKRDSNEAKQIQSQLVPHTVKSVREEKHPT